MARTRTIRPGFFSSFTMAKVPREVRLFFSGLWVEADDDGRLVDSPKMLAGAIFPHDEDVTAKKVDGWLKKLADIGLIERYEANGGRYIWVRSFAEHQKPPHPTPSKLPPPPSRQAHTEPVETREDCVSDSRSSHENPVSDSRAGLGLGFLSPVVCSMSLGDAPETVASQPVENPAGRHLALTQALIDACHGRSKLRVITEAKAVTEWALRYVDHKLIEEAISWASNQDRPPDLPRAVAKLIRQKASDRKIVMPEFVPVAA